MGILISWLTLSIGLWASHKIIKGFHIEGGLSSFILLGAVVGLLHFFLGWFIFAILGIATLGIAFLLSFLTRLVITAIILKLAGAMSKRFTIVGFLPAFLAACLMSLVSFGVDLLLHS